MQALNEWWDALDGAMQFFYAIAFLSTAILVVQTALMLCGFDSHGTDVDSFDVSHDFDHGGDHGGGEASVFSVRTVTAFLVGFGWMGAILRDLGWSLFFVLPLALLVGFILMMSVFWFMRVLHGLRESGNLDYAYAIGETGTVYLPIPPRKEKAGKIEVLIQGRLAIVDAFTRSDERIENRAKVRVLDVIGDSALLVEPL